MKTDVQKNVRSISRGPPRLEGPKILYGNCRSHNLCNNETQRVVLKKKCLKKPKAHKSPLKEKRTAPANPHMARRLAARTPHVRPPASFSHCTPNSLLPVDLLLPGAFVRLRGALGGFGLRRFPPVPGLGTLDDVLLGGVTNCQFWCQLPKIEV